MNKVIWIVLLLVVVGGCTMKQPRPRYDTEIWMPIVEGNDE